MYFDGASATDSTLIQLAWPTRRPRFYGLRGRLCRGFGHRWARIAPNNPTVDVRECRTCHDVSAWIVQRVAP